VLRSPDPIVDDRAQEVWLLASRGRDTLTRRLDAAQRTTSELRASLRALSPAATLARGYAIAHLDDGRILTDAVDAPAGTALTVTVDRGSLRARSEGQVSEDA
jgi:exodeoxyribonuclease VII large subunit